MSKEVIAALMGAAVGGLLTGFFSYLIGKYSIQATHRNDLELMRQQSFSNACANFTNAFIEELVKLEVEGKDAYVDILRPAVQKHKTAVHIFRQAIADDIKRAAFDKAWEDYYENKHQPNSPLRQYATQLEQTDDFERGKRRPLAISRIKALLEFAEKK